MSQVERALWRIAELGARCSQAAASGGRSPLWVELEQIIAGLQADFEATGRAEDSAPAQVRSLEGRLKVAQQERNRERARAKECFADAEAARRERDRERQKAQKAVAAATQAKAAVVEAQRAAADALARASATEAAARHATAARNQALRARDEAFAQRDRAVAARNRALAARDEAVAARDEVVRALEQAHARLAELESTVAAAPSGQDEALDTTAARPEGAVVVLPAVASPETPAGPMVPASRVSWQPTWSEWASPDDTVAVPAVPTPALAGVTADEIRLDEPFRMEEDGPRRYLNVAATIGQLLPEDLGPLLLSGATVVRREGRLYATVAVPTKAWAPSGCDGTQQAERFADAGFRVEWTSSAPLGV